jgi:flagellar motor protein MotB
MSGGASPVKAWKWVGGTAIAAVVLGLVLAGLLAFVVPGIAITQASRGMEAATGRKLAIGALSIHPFTWQVEVKDLSLSEPGGNGTFASFRSGTVTVSPSSIWRGAPVISQVRLVDPHFNVIRTGPGAFNFSDLLKYLIVPVPALSLNDVAITGGSIDFLDRALPQEERHTVRDAELMIPFLTTIPALASQYGNPSFRALVDGAPLAIETQVRGLPRAPEVSAQVDLQNVSLPVYLAYLPARIPFQVDSGSLSVKGTASYRVTEAAGPEVAWDGTVEVGGIEVSEPQGPGRVAVSGVAFRSRVTLGKKLGMILDGGTVEIRDLSVPFGKNDGMKLGLLSITGARFVEKENRLEVEDLLLADGKIRISRDRKGVFSPMPYLERLQRKLPKGSPSAGEPVQYRVKKLEGRDLDLSFTDGTRKELPSFTVSRVTFQADEVTGPLAGPIAFSCGARVGKAATFQARGKVVPTPLAADVELELTGFDLSAGGPYVPEGMDLTIAGGRLDLRLAVALATRKDQLTGTYGGSYAVRSLKLLGRKRGKLVAWEELSVEGMKGTVDPVTLRIGKVVLSGLRADLVMGKDGNLNLPKLPEGAPAAATTPPPAAGPGDAGLRSIRVDEFVLKDGAVNFTDEGVPGDFHAAIQDLSVRVTGISSEPGKFATVRAQMTLPRGAPLRVSGKAAPLKRPAYADLDLVLEGLDLSAATPYAGVHLGLEIDRGSLTVKSRARVEQGKLSAENRIRVDQLTFGKAVKSDRATILPVRLLVDIMRNKDGDIVLDLPVSAKTDDEDLAGTITGQIVKEVIFPPGSPLRDISFAACSAELDPDAQGRLRKLAGALQERPAMKITAFGYVDREGDGKACPEGEARLKQLAEGRAAAVREFLVLQGGVEAPRVSAATGDVFAAPREKGQKQARVEFARATD